MKFTVNPGSIEWWYWFVTFALIIAVLTGWQPGYQGVMIVSAFQVVHFSITKGLVVFQTQVRWFYFLITLTAFLPEIKVYMFWALWVGTTMVTFFDRCILARILVMMPWNKGVQLT